MALKLNAIGMDARAFFYRIDGPLVLIRAFYKHFVKDARISFLWILFWVSFAFFAIAKIRLLVTAAS